MSMNKEVARIAKDVLDIDTLEEQHKDSSDFHDLHVAAIKKALEQAYDAGREGGYIDGQNSMLPQ